MAVRVLEPPSVSDKLDWLLLSRDGVTMVAVAERLVQWHKAECGFEEMFRIFKSATRIEDQRLCDGDSTAHCFALDSNTRYAPEPTGRGEVCGGRDGLHLAVQPGAAGRGTGDAPARTDLGMETAIAQMAGWYPSKRRPLPSNEVPWRANRTLRSIVKSLQVQRRAGRLALPSGENQAPLNHPAETATASDYKYSEWIPVGATMY